MRFILKTLFVYVLTIVLIDGNTPFIGKFVAQKVFAEEVATMDFETLTGAYEGLFAPKRTTSNGALVPDYAALQENLGSPRGQQVMDQTQAFIKNPSNRAQLATPDGQRLLELHNKMVRLKKIKTSMESCFGEASGKADLLQDYDGNTTQKYTGGLPERVLAAAIMRPEGEVPCDPGLLQVDSLNELFGGIAPIVNRARDAERVEALNKLQKSIDDKNLENAIKTLVNLEVTYAGDEVSAANPPINDAKADEIVGSICDFVPPQMGGAPQTRTFELCSSEQRDHLKQVTLREQQNLLANPNLRTYSKDSAARELKSRIQNLNTVIDGLEFDIDEGYVADGIDTSTQKSQESYQRYISNFMSMASDGPGLLMWTSAIGDEMGMRRDQQRAFMGIWGGGFNEDTRTFYPHNHNFLNEDVVNNAISEAKQEVVQKAFRSHASQRRVEREAARYVEDGGGFLSSSLNQGHIVERRTEDLKEIIKNNPNSVGQALLENPELADEACFVMQDMAQEAKDDDHWLSASNLMWGALIVGGVLLGGAALIGLGMLAFAGTAAAGAAVLSSLTVPGLVFGVAESAMAVSRATTAAARRDELRASLLSGTTDQEGASEFYSAMDEAHNAWIEAGLALGFTALDAAAFMHVARQMGNINDARRYLSRVGTAGRKMATSRKFRRMFSAIRPAIGKAKVQKFMDELLKLDDGLDFLNKIENLSIEEATELFRNGYVACTRFCS